MSENLMHSEHDDAQAHEEEQYYPGPDDNEEVFPGGPTWAEVQAWRQEYGEVFSLPIAGQMFIFRLLRRFEYKDIMRQRQQDPWWREEKTVELCVLWPEGYSGAAIAHGSAGVPTMLAEHIMEKSGFIAADDEAQPLDPKNF